MHLGPVAMQMIGEGIADDIAENRRDAWFSHEEEHAGITSAEKPAIFDEPKRQN